MTLKRFLFRTIFATVFIAAGAIYTEANGQNSFIDLAGKTSGASAGSVVTTEQVRAELLAWAPDGVGPGKQVWLGLQLAHQPEWHTYWKNAGDSGLPTQLDWQLPAGISAGEIAWPTPKKIPIGTLANYGYEGTVLLPVPLAVNAGVDAVELDIRLKASWLVCKKECIPQEGEFAIKLPARSSTASSSQAFQGAFAATPTTLPASGSQIEVAGNAIKVSVAGLPAALKGRSLALFPETGSVIEPAGAWQQAWQGALWTAQLPLSGQRTESPRLMPLVVALDEPAPKDAGTGNAFRVEVPVSGEWPQVAAAVPVPPALEAALKANAVAGAVPAASAQGSTAPMGMWAALLGALLGGLLLNLMPCVFPVLAIKVTGFVNVKSQASRVAAGLAYSAGVVLSFVALGALLLGLRAAGEELGWGFQLQNPAVVAGLAALFTLIGLNLAGLFEVGNFLPARLANLQAKNPSVDSFLSGVLATAIASPCTAPFMGASLGYAVGLPPLEALAIFAAIGIGMALPYLVVSIVPAVAKALPRPGPWMVTFKQLMAFPMFATVAWLVWVLGQQSGIDGAGSLLGLLVLMALVLWALTLQGRTRRVIATLSVAAGAVTAWDIAPNVIKIQDNTAAPVQLASGWQRWEPGRVEQLTAQGQNVFV
ncbi:MAG: protein-disulfide reductase, partial [Polaromonas sp.]|nr:protein-disulfide reductase [Polaromonas sp.]